MAQRYLEDASGGRGGSGGNISSGRSNDSGGVGGNTSGSDSTSTSINVSVSGSGSGVGVGVDVIDWSHLIYRSPRGYLGYEWGTFSDNCHKPAGLWPLSTTTHTIQHGLSEWYGASYRGSGTVTHRLSLYRTQPASEGSVARGGGADKGSGQGQRRVIPPSSLVFGAGTVQWSFALSSFHDGEFVPTGTDDLPLTTLYHFTSRLITLRYVTSHHVTTPHERRIYPLHIPS